MKVRMLGCWDVRAIVGVVLHPIVLTSLLSTSLLAQTPHDITMVDKAPLGGAIATPLLEAQRKQLAKYEIPELVGSRQALGSQLIEGTLPEPLVDYVAQDAKVQQRVSIFQGGLVVVDVRGAGGPIRKKVIIPDDALKNYLRAVSTIATVRQGELVAPKDNRRALLRVYTARHQFTERMFDPVATLPRTINDQIAPLRDLMRAICEDRAVTNSVAGYVPKPGDELVGDDRKVYKVMRVMNDSIVELRCTSQPTTIYVEVKDLYNYFIGTTGASQQ
ncbi:MAG TPA: hypothetical protein VKL19_04905 [Thermoanaerobaculia bacterium]|nr:hypothetical protein [Thermoanaerobaculia bacterium]